jgi:iron transport multicopper oxidase
VRQDAIKNTFVYDFVASETGTYWIHSHDPGQYPKGIRSPFIVTDDAVEKSLLGYTQDYTMTVSDW